MPLLLGHNIKSTEFRKISVFQLKEKHPQDAKVSTLSCNSKTAELPSGISRPAYNPHLYKCSQLRHLTFEVPVPPRNSATASSANMQTGQWGHNRGICIIVSESFL